MERMLKVRTICSFLLWKVNLVEISTRVPYFHEPTGDTGGIVRELLRALNRGLDTLFLPGSQTMYPVHFCVLVR